MVEPDYWSAAATVMPVLAAALVIEGRQLRELSRADNYPPWMLGIQYFLTAACMAGMGLAVSQCFQALRGVPPSPVWFQVIEWSISGSIGTLVLAPAAVLVSNGSVIYFYILRRVPLRVQLARAKRYARRLERQWNSTYWRQRAYALKELHYAEDLQRQIAHRLANPSIDTATRSDLIGKKHEAETYREAMSEYLQKLEDSRELVRKGKAAYEQVRSPSEKPTADAGSKSSE